MASPVSLPNSLSRPSFKYNLQTLRTLPGYLNQHERGFPVSVINALYNTIFWAYSIDSTMSVSWETWTMNVQRLPQCHWWTAFSRPSSKYKYPTDWRLCLLGKLNNKHAEHFKTILWVILSYQLIKVLSPRESEQWKCRASSVTNKWPFQDHLLSKTIS